MSDNIFDDEHTDDVDYGNTEIELTPKDSQDGEKFRNASRNELVAYIASLVFVIVCLIIAAFVAFFNHEKIGIKVENVVAYKGIFAGIFVVVAIVIALKASYKFKYKSRK